MKVEEFEAHPVWTTLDALEQEVDKDLDPQNDDERYAVRRLHAVVEYLDSLRDVDALLVEAQGPGDLNSHLTQVLNHVRNYLANPVANRAHLTSAAGAVQNVMNTARQWFPAPSADEATRAAKASATRYKNSLDSEIERLQGQIQDLRQHLADEQAKRASSETAATERLSELQANITAGEQQVDALTAKLNKQIDDQRTAFEQEAAQRATAFKESEQARETAEEERIDTAGEEARAALTKQEEDAQTVLTKLTDYQDQAAALVDTTSRHAIAGDYGTWASHQARAAFWWTVATVVIGLGTVIGLIVAIHSVAKDSIQFTVYKTSISVIGLIVAGYAARQASEHRKEERTAKRLALDLAALEPFLGNVENPEELRTEIARRVFVPQESTGSDGDATLRTRRGALSLRELTDLIAAFRQPPA